MAPLNGGDVENGAAEKEAGHLAQPSNDNVDMGEYGNLVRYISTYKDGRRGSQVSSIAPSIDEPDKKKKWYQRKSKGPNGQFETPEEWLNTDMKAGLTTGDVDKRRKHTGYNELTTEKENLFLKFLSYFQGPILYGTSRSLSLSDCIIDVAASYGTRCPSCWWSS